MNRRGLYKNRHANQNEPRKKEYSLEIGKYELIRCSDEIFNEIHKKVYFSLRDLGGFFFGKVLPLCITCDDIIPRGLLFQSVSHTCVLKVANKQ